MKLRIRFICFFITGLLFFVIYMGLAIGLLLEYVFPLLKLDNSGNDLKSFMIVFFLPFVSGGTIWGLYFVNPLISITSLITQLSLNNYDLNAADQKLYNRHGKLKKRYFLYKEVITNLYSLALVLENSANKEAKLKLAKEGWIRGVSHDLRIPLSYIVGYSALLTNKNYSWTNDEIHNFSSLIFDKGKDLEELISDLRLQLSFQPKDIKNNIPLRKEFFDIIPLLQELIADVAKLPDANGCSLEFSNFENSLFIYADKKLLHRAFQNLLVNAVFHNRHNVQISVSFFHYNNELHLEFCDDGTGINMDLLEPLFNDDYPFTQNHGLSIVKSIIFAHGGQVSIKNLIPQGCKFCIQLPLNT